MLIYRKFITRDMLRSEPDKIFVFGDNMQRVGMGGQAAAMRGEPNAYGIPTKWSPSMDKDAFFTDDDFDRIEPIFSNAYVYLVNAGKPIIWPLDGIGTGLARLPESSPKLWALLEYIRTSLEMNPKVGV